MLEFQALPLVLLASLLLVWKFKFYGTRRFIKRLAFSELNSRGPLRTARTCTNRIQSLQDYARKPLPCDFEIWTDGAYNPFWDIGECTAVFVYREPGGGFVGHIHCTSWTHAELHGPALLLDLGKSSAIGKRGGILCECSGYVPLTLVHVRNQLDWSRTTWLTYIPRLLQLPPSWVSGHVEP